MGRNALVARVEDGNQSLKTGEESLNRSLNRAPGAFYPHLKVMNISNQAGDGMHQVTGHSLMVWSCLAALALMEGWDALRNLSETAILRNHRSVKP